MMRRTTQLPPVSAGDYARWCKEFEDGPFVRMLLAKFDSTEAERIRMVLFVAHLRPQQLTREQVQRIWPQLKTRINLTDYAIISVAALLKEKKLDVNADTAALLTAACVPGGKPSTCAWSAEAIKKRREHARKHPWVSMWGPRFQWKRLIDGLVRARQAE
jgi:hypothetical protein